MNTDTICSHRARRRRRFTAPLLLIGPAVAAAVLLSAAPAAVSTFGSAAPSPATISGDHIELVNTIHAPLPLRPQGDGPTPAPSPGGPGPVSLDDKPYPKGYIDCVANGNGRQSCCLMYDGKWDGQQVVCTFRRMDAPWGGPGLPTEAVDTGSPQQGGPPLPPVAVDPGSPQIPPTTTPPPVIRDHRTP